MTPEKTSPKELIEEIADKFIVYLKAGKLSPNSFIKELDLNINNIEQLLRIHFILKKEVKDFVEKLPWRIRNIKTSTRKIKQLLQGEVRGRISWQETIKTRSRTNFSDNRAFVCEETDKNFNIKENLVLKKLLSVITNILMNDLKVWQKDYGWLADWLKDEKLAESIYNLYSRNVYLKRINSQNILVTGRMIQDTKKSRNILYKEAAELLELFNKLTSFDKLEEDKNEIINLLNNTFIRPQKDEVLFELYWVIKLIEANTDSYQLNLIEGEDSLVASWTTEEKIYYLYHDSIGSGRLNFQVTLDELRGTDNDYLKRRLKGRQIAVEIAEKIFEKRLNDTFWEGRPDIIIEVYNKQTSKLDEVIIGEIKYTNKTETAVQGLKELMNYCSLIKNKNTYIHNKNLVKTNFKVTGLLLFDKIEFGDDYNRGVIISKNEMNNWRGKIINQIYL